MSDTSGSAFPIVGEHGVRMENSAGMTLRDYFAAKAMQSLLHLWWKDLNNADGRDFCGLNLIDNEGGTPGVIADESFAMADVMLKARKS